MAEWEGSESHVYRDVAGLPTIGVGHLLTQDELSSGKIIIDSEEVRYGEGLTEAQIIALLGQDLDRFETCVTNSAQVDLTQNQFDALVSFAFNVGITAFRNSTLLKRLNQGNYDEVPNQMRRWVYSGGQRVIGLINRRENESNLWMA